MKYSRRGNVFNIRIQLIFVTKWRALVFHKVENILWHSCRLFRQPKLETTEAQYKANAEHKLQHYVQTDW
jgi:hypothetical protein